MAFNATNFGATIVPAPNTTSTAYLAQPGTESPALTPATSHDGTLQETYAAKPVPPQSPFYQHPPASHEVVTTKKTMADVYEKDLESGKDVPLSPASSAEGNPFTQRIGVEHNPECTMWPSKQTLKEKYKQSKAQRRTKEGLTCCAPLRNKWSTMSMRNRVLAKVFIALLVIGVAVAIGVSISIAVKGSYYAGDGKNKNVQQS